MAKGKILFTNGGLTAALMLVALGHASRAVIPPEVEQGVLEQKWDQVREGLTSDEMQATDPVARLLAGHACLATNRNNESLFFFGSVQDNTELEKWAEWTTSLLQSHPDHAVAHYLRGDALARLGKFNAAVSEFSMALDKDGRFSLASVARGTVETMQGEIDAAVVDLMGAIGRAPNLAEAYAAMGTHYVVRSEAAHGALKFFDQAIEINPEFALAYVGRAGAHYGVGDFDQAFADLEQAVAFAPEVVGLCDRNQAAVLAVADQYLQMVSNSSQAGTTIETKTGFEHRKVSLSTGDPVDVYVVRLPENYSFNSVQTLARNITDEVRHQLGIPQVNFHVTGHGWRDSPENHLEHAALMAKASGAQAAIVLDFPEFRSISGTLWWHGASVSGARKTGTLVAAINSTPGAQVWSLKGESGMAENIVRMNELVQPELRQHLQVATNVVLDSYPFSAVPFVPRKVNDEWLKQVGGTVYVNRTSPGAHLDPMQGKLVFHWSNPLQGTGDKLVNVPMTLAGEGIGHARWKDLTVPGWGINPSLILETQQIAGAPRQTVLDLAERYSRDRTPLTSWQAFWNTNAGLTVTDLVKSAVSAAGGFSLDPKTGQVPEIEQLHRREAFRDRRLNDVPTFVLPPNSTPADIADFGKQLIAAVPPLKSMSGVDYPRQVVVQGPLAPQIEKELAYQGIQVRRSFLDRDLTSLQAVTNKIGGDALVVAGGVRGVPSTEMKVVLDGVAMHTTLDNLANGRLPTTQVERALHDERTMTEQFRRLSPAVTLPSASASMPFQPIPVSSFGQNKLADVWHWDASESNAREIATQTTVFAKSLGQQKMVLRTDSEAAIRPLVDQLRRNGLDVTVAVGQREGTAKLGALTAGMGQWTETSPQDPIVVGFYSGQSIAPDLKALGIRQDNPLYDLTRLTGDIKENRFPVAGGPALIVGDDRFRSTLLMNQLTRQGIPAIQVPSEADWRGMATTFHSPVVAGIQSDLSEVMKKAQLPPPLPPRTDGIGIPTRPWTGFDFLKPTPILPGQTAPGGVDCSMARAKLDKGKWLVTTTFGLLYPMSELPEGGAK